MRIRQKNPSLSPAHPWACLLILCTTLLTGVLTDEVVTQAPLGGSTNFNWKAEKDMKIIQIEWNKCPEQKVFVFSPQLGLSILDKTYEGRLSIETNHSLKLQKIQETDFGQYCYKLTTFPEGSLQRQIKLVKETENGPSDPPTMMIIYITCGIGLAVVCAVITGVVFYKKRRSKVRNPVHVALRPGGPSQPSILQKDQDRPNNTRRESEGDVETDDGNYLNVP